MADRTMQFSIILTQGLNRQIRRMCEYLGYRVTALHRVRIMNIRLDGMKKGELRPVTGQELEQLKEMLKDSSSLSVRQRLEKDTYFCNSKDRRLNSHDK